MSMLKEFIQKEHPSKKSKSNESGKCPILPDLADIYSPLEICIKLLHLAIHVNHSNLCEKSTEKLNRFRRSKFF